MRPAALFLLLLTVAFSVVFAGQAPAAPRTFLLFFDDLHLEFQDSPRLRLIAARALRTLIRDGDRWGLVSTGASSVSLAPTSDLALLESTIRRITGNGLPRSELLERGRRSESAMEQRRRAAVAFSTAIAAMDAVAVTQQGRSFAVLYFSNGYDAALIPEPTELIEAAARANAAVYAFDPRGLTGAVATQGTSRADWDAYIAATRHILSTLANRTQGMAVLNVEDFGAAMSRMAMAER